MAVYQDATGRAEEKVIALGVAIGSGYLYKTTFEKEVFSDLYGGKKVRDQFFLLVLWFESEDIHQGPNYCLPRGFLPYLPQCSNIYSEE